MNTLIDPGDNVIPRSPCRDLAADILAPAEGATGTVLGSSYRDVQNDVTTPEILGQREKKK